MTNSGVAEMFSHARSFSGYDFIGRTPFRLSLGRMLPSRACLRLAENLRFGWEVAGRDEHGFGGFSSLIVTPVRLEEDGVDLLEIDGFGAVPYGLDE